MKTMMLAVAGVFALGMPYQAEALDVLSTNGTGPVGNCQAALPRMREGSGNASAVVSESDTNAYVTARSRARRCP